MLQEKQYDHYTCLAQLYDTQDLNYPVVMPSSNEQRIGAIAESKFITDCLERDFEPHLPVTPMPWDFIVHCPAGDLKVQVKCTSCRAKEGCFVVNTSSGQSNKEHVSDLVDVVACYVSPIDTWWMMPQSDVTSKTVKLYEEHNTKSKYKKYQNNWSIYYK
jgi:hypothetical protein